MENQLIELIQQYKQGNSNSFMSILNKMYPLLTKYAAILRFDDFEDMLSEFTLALLECINNMQFYKNEYEVLHYMNQAITNRFHELYRSSKKRLDEAYCISDDSKSFEAFLPAQHPTDYSDIIFKTDMSSFIEQLPANKQSIAFSILIEGLSDIEISRKHSLSRQYIHRLRKQFYDKLTSEFY